MGNGSGLELFAIRRIWSLLMSPVRTLSTSILSDIFFIPQACLHPQLTRIRGRKRGLQFRMIYFGIMATIIGKDKIIPKGTRSNYSPARRVGVPLGRFDLLLRAALLSLDV